MCSEIKIEKNTYIVNYLQINRNFHTNVTHIAKMQMQSKTSITSIYSCTIFVYPRVFLRDTFIFYMYISQTT